jgi:hypothetical protein
MKFKAKETGGGLTAGKIYEGNLLVQDVKPGRPVELKIAVYNDAHNWIIYDNTRFTPIGSSE